MTYSNIVFFCHGAPGSPRDAELLPAVGPDTLLIAHDVFGSPADSVIEGALSAFDLATARFSPNQIRIVGFSIGAMVAIKLAAARADQVGGLTLISAAAPLPLGDFLSKMAGKPVFDLAQNSPIILKFLTKVQCLLASIAPKLLFNQLFHKSGVAERALLTDPKFRDILKAGFGNSFCNHPAAYTAILRAYITDWREDIGRVTCPVTLWHGDNDSWSPPVMSQALQSAFSGPATLHSLKGAEHYTTLRKAKL